MHRQRSLLLLIIICGYATCLWSQQYTAMADVLKEEHIPFPPASIPHLNASITSYAVLNDSNEFLIAYYLADPITNTLKPPLYLTRYGKNTGQWQHVALDPTRVEKLTQSPYGFGSVLNVVHSGKRYYLDLHWNPSAGCLLILNENLMPEDALLGWPRGWFRSGAVLYTRNMIHFADVHPETLWLYDPETHESQQLYPEQDDPFRTAFSDRLAKVINNDQCRIKNWGCDPQDFTTELGDVDVNDTTHSVAVQVTFESEGFVDREVAENSDEWNPDEYIYVYQLQPFRWREFRREELKQKFGTEIPKQLLEPKNIEKVFATPAPN